KVIGTSERHIGANAELRRASAEASADEVEAKPFGIREARAHRQNAAALTHPCGGRYLSNGGKHGLANLRQQMNMLMAIDKIRQSPKRARERRDLGGHFGPDGCDVQPVQASRPDGVV